MRDAVIIFVSIILAMGIGGYLFLIGTPSSKEDASTTAPVRVEGDGSFIVLAEGQDAGSLTRRTNYRITDDAQFAELWRMVYEDAGPPLPVVDFSRYEVIGVFDGSHSTGGYRVSVTGISDGDASRTVTIRRESPGDTCVVSEGFTSPFVLLRAEKTLLPITREEEEVVIECP